MDGTGTAGNLMAGRRPVTTWGWKRIENRIPAAQCGGVPTFFQGTGGNRASVAALVVPGHRSPSGLLALGVPGRHPGRLPPSRRHQLGESEAGGRQVLGHADPPRVAVDILPAREACGQGSPAKAVPDRIGMQAKDEFGPTRRRTFRPDGQQGLNGCRTQVEDHPLGLLVRLGLGDHEAAAAIIRQLHILPTELRGLGDPEQTIAHDRAEGNIHQAAAPGIFHRLNVAAPGAAADEGSGADGSQRIGPEGRRLLLRPPEQTGQALHGLRDIGALGNGPAGQLGRP